MHQISIYTKILRIQKKNPTIDLEHCGQKCGKNWQRDFSDFADLGKQVFPKK